VIETGDTAPDFELPDQDGRPVRLSDLRGRPVVLYFYPRADTPGCTTQACGVRDHLPDYEDADAVVLGASPDPVDAVKRFHDKQGLTTFWGVQRATFIIDPEGRVAHAIPKVSPKTHDEEALGALAQLRDAA
jgi:peroxiredoxin Q/BCP